MYEKRPNGISSKPRIFLTCNELYICQLKTSNDGNNKTPVSLVAEANKPITPAAHQCSRFAAKTLATVKNTNSDSVIGMEKK